MRQPLIAAAALLALAGTARAETLDFNIGPDSLRGFFAGPLAKVSSGLGGQYDFGFIYKEGENGSTDPDDSKLKLAHAGVLATGDAGISGAESMAGLGVRAVYADRSLAGASASGLALAFGGQFNVRLPSFERVGITGYGWYAPSITSFSDIKNYSELALDVEFEVVRAAAVYAGYRLVNVKPDGGGSQEADSSGHVGLKLNF